ncbi:unnamed protein product [marine sediment metagenome]|uniref:Metallo-beta-lactamase domain-containing protein n=1 Tax=marine sediment metagenome TaxID=412755 RepID=X0WCW6_9ZZZZ
MKSFTLPPATHTNAFLLGSRELLLIDPGSPIQQEQDKLLAYLQQSGSRVHEIWLTHQHPDHVDGVERLRGELGVPVAAHRLTADACEFAVDRFIEDGEETTLNLGDGVRAHWVALHTPGHAAGHLCFFERERKFLLTGDNVVSLSTVFIAPPEGNMIQYLQSLERLAELDASFLFPGHGPPVATPTKKIREYIDHRLAREAAILAAIDQPLEPIEIVRAVYASEPEAVYPLAELNVRAHLEKLVAEGSAREENGRFLTSSPP